MAAAAGLYAVAAGNIGPNAVAELSKAEAAGALPDIWVLELSSFQLETTHTLNCTSAALLNITEDHLDWHGSIEAYAHAKGRIFAPDTVRVVNREDPLVMAELEKVDDREQSAARCFTFGATKPQKEGELGLMMAAHASQGYWLGLRDQMEVDVLFLPEFELLIRGRHNAMNALAALDLLRAPALKLGLRLACSVLIEGSRIVWNSYARLKAAISLTIPRGPMSAQWLPPCADLPLRDAEF